MSAAASPPPLAPSPELQRYRAAALALQGLAGQLRAAMQEITEAAHSWDPTDEQSDDEAEAAIFAAAQDLSALTRESKPFRVLLIGMRPADAPAVGQPGEVPA